MFEKKKKKKIFKSWQVCDWLGKWIIMLPFMDLRWPRVFGRSSHGLVFFCARSMSNWCQSEGFFLTSWLLFYIEARNLQHLQHGYLVSFLLFEWQSFAMLTWLIMLLIDMQAELWSGPQFMGKSILVWAWGSEVLTEWVGGRKIAVYTDMTYSISSKLHKIGSIYQTCEVIYVVNLSRSV